MRNSKQTRATLLFHDCATLLSSVTMVRRKCLTDQENADIVSKLANGKSVSNIAATLSRDVRTVRKFVSNPLAKAIRKDKGKSKVLTKRDLLRVKRQLRKNPNSTSKNILDNVGLCHVLKSTRCRVLRHMAKHVMPAVRPPLKLSHKDSRLEWARNYMKSEFKHVLFTGEMRPLPHSKVWVPEDAPRPQRLRRQ